MFNLSEVYLPSHESKCLRVCLLGVSILPPSLQCFVEIRTVLGDTVFLVFHLFIFIKTNVQAYKCKYFTRITYRSMSDPES